ncbi:MAG: PAS domain S-box protein [Polyangiaceae bacterium]|nr:PAS domain S-box protein [Polyangiaceae bacterium]
MTNGAPDGTELARENAALRRRLNELEESEARFRAAFELSPVVQAIAWAKDGRYVDVNEAFCAATGLARAEAIGRTAVELGVIANAEARTDLLAYVRSRGRVDGMRTLIHRANGETRECLVAARVLGEGEQAQVFSVVEDVTDRLTNVARFESIYSHSPIAIEVYDGNGSLLDANPACLALFGVDSVDGVKGLRLFEDPNLPPHAVDALRRGEHFRYEGRFDFDRVRELDLYQTTRSGQLWLDVLITPVQTGPLGYLVQIVETTERRRAEDALREERWRLRSIIEGTQTGTWEWNVQTGDTVFDARWAEIVGLRSEDLGPTNVHTWRNLAHPEDLDRSDSLLERHFAGELQSYDCECRMKHREGHWVWVHDRGEVITWTAEGRPLLMFGTRTDITARKLAEREQERLQAALMQSQKLEAIGTLAGGVAHDFNNILGGVLSGLSLLELDVGNNPEIQASVQDMKTLVERGADLTRKLLGFSRRGKYDARPIDLGWVARQTVAMFARTRRDLVIECEFARDLPAVRVDHAQLEQILLDLLLNAGQAMPNGGRIRLRAEDGSLTEEQANFFQVAPGRFVKLVVADTGVGMDTATQARLFEPFFTTKASERHSGLGLPSVYGIIKNHGGIITVESAPGAGTAFTLFLPATDMPAEETRPPRATSPTRSGTILIVDDEELLLKLHARLLAGMGYDVLTAASGKEAIRLVQKHREQLSLVILDLVMPEMSGATTFDALREVAPELKVLLSSGFAVDGQAEELLARGCNDFIQKPFDRATLFEKVRSLL